MVPPATNSGQESGDTLPEIKYAVIGYGACGAQFVSDLILESLILHYTNKEHSNPPKDDKYHLHITVFSSQGENEAGGGEAWSSDQDGCINSPIPGHPNMPHKDYLPSTLRYKRLVALVTDLPGETGKAVWEDFDALMDRFDNDNKPGAALIWGRSQGSEFDTSRPCIPRAVLGSVRKKGLQGIIDFANKHGPGVTVDLKYKTRAVLDNITNPEKPVVKYTPLNKEAKTEEFDKVVNCSGSRITSIVPEALKSLVYSNPINNKDFKAYLEKRKCGDPKEGKIIGVAGALLNFVDCLAILGTLRGFFDFDKDQQLVCSVTSRTLDKFFVFSRREGGSVKPRLSSTKDWPHPSYLAAEHTLALRTQKNFDWVTVTQAIWKSMISFVMKIHPKDFSSKHPTTMEDQWALYSQECKAFRKDEKTPTYCGLERILVDAIFHGYGAEPSVDKADERMKEAFPAIFVGGEQMSNVFYAHVSNITFLNGFRESNSSIHAILREWYRTYSSSPVDICEPIFELHGKGVLKHKTGDVTKITDSGDGKITIGGEKVDALFSPGLFGQGLDDVVDPILSKLKTQAPRIPSWKALGQLVRADDKLVNVWDYGNNRGVGLDYTHTDKNGKKVTSEVISRSAVNLLSATHEFAPSLATCLLAHDLYSIKNGFAGSSASESLQNAIKDQSPKREDYDNQMKKLENYYVEGMKRFYFLQAIESATADTEKWKEYYNKGLQDAQHSSIIGEMLKGTQAQKDAASAYQTNVKTITRDAMDYEEWRAPFTDLGMPEAWNILENANK